MKHLLTLAALFVSTLSLAQQMPYNPDANGDDFVGVDDVLGVLGVYDTALMQPDLTCDYEGTDLEQLIGGLFDQTLVLDSVYVEYLYSDSVLTYLPGCPDAVFIETILERSYVIDDFSYSNSNVFTVFAYIQYLGHARQLEFRFYPEDGKYNLYLIDGEIESATNYNDNSFWQGQDYSSAYMPFPENWTLNDDGIIVDWGADTWVANCESFRLIPFWHEAE
jgi:hypothetical protein